MIRRGAGALLVMMGLILAFEAPAGADNCDELLEQEGIISSVGDEAVVSDCLRTGGVFGQTVGTVVAVVGVGIATIGMSRTKTKDPRIPTEKVDAGRDPCVAKNQWRNRLNDLEAAKGRLEDMIRREYGSYAAEAERLAHHYESIRQGRWYANAARIRAGLITTGGYGAAGAAVVGAGAAIASAATALGGTLPAGVTSAMPWLVPVEGAGAFGATAIGSAGGVAARTAGSAVAGVGMAGVGPYSVPPFTGIPLDIYPDFEIKFNPLAAGVSERDKLLNEIGRNTADYLNDAARLNRNWAAWGAERQADLNRLHQEFNDAFNQAKAAHEACRQQEGGFANSVASRLGLMPSELKPYDGLVPQSQILIGQLPLMVDVLNTSQMPYFSWPEPSRLFR